MSTEPESTSDGTEASEPKKNKVKRLLRIGRKVAFPILDIATDAIPVVNATKKVIKKIRKH